MFERQENARIQVRLPEEQRLEYGYAFTLVIERQWPSTHDAEPFAFRDRLTPSKDRRRIAVASIDGDRTLHVTLRPLVEGRLEIPPQVLRARPRDGGPVLVVESNTLQLDIAPALPATDAGSPIEAPRRMFPAPRSPFPWWKLGAGALGVLGLAALLVWRRQRVRGRELVRARDEQVRELERLRRTEIDSHSAPHEAQAISQIARSWLAEELGRETAALTLDELRDTSDARAQRVAALLESLDPVKYRRAPWTERERASIYDETLALLEISDRS